MSAIMLGGGIGRKWQPKILVCAAGWVELDGQQYDFVNAPAYIEKNWGAGFPKKWFWLQCNAFPDHPGLTLTAVGAQRRMLQPYAGYGGCQVPLPGST
jgi:hypothetical protein